VTHGRISSMHTPLACHPNICKYLIPVCAWKNLHDLIVPCNLGCWVAWIPLFFDSRSLFWLSFFDSMFSFHYGLECWRTSSSHSKNSHLSCGYCDAQQASPPGQASQKQGDRAEEPGATSEVPESCPRSSDVPGHRLIWSFFDYSCCENLCWMVWAWTVNLLCRMDQGSENYRIFQVNRDEDGLDGNYMVWLKQYLAFFENLKDRIESFRAWLPLEIKLCLKYRTVTEPFVNGIYYIEYMQRQATFILKQRFLEHHQSPCPQSQVLWNGTSFLYNQNLKRE